MVQSRHGWISAGNSLEELDLPASTHPPPSPPQLPWLGGREGRKVWDKKSSGAGHREKRAHTPHNLKKAFAERHNVTDRTACGMEETHAESPDRVASCHRMQGSPHSDARSIRSSNERYQKLTKYTHRHLPDPDIISTAVLVSAPSPTLLPALSAFLQTCSPSPFLFSFPLRFVLFCLLHIHEEKLGNIFREP